MQKKGTAMPCTVALSTWLTLVQIKLPFLDKGRAQSTLRCMYMVVLEANHSRIVGYHFSSRLTATLNLFPIYLKLLLHVYNSMASAHMILK